MSVYDEVQMQITKTVRNVPLSHGHRHEVVNATGRSRCRWRFAPDCPTRQPNAVSDRQRLAPSPDNHGPASYPTPCSQQSWGRGCWEATDWEHWKPELLAAVTRPSHGPYCVCKITKLTILSSQGSAATRLRCGGQCNKNFVAAVKKIENRLIFARVMDRSTRGPFLTHSVEYAYSIVIRIATEI